MHACKGESMMKNKISLSVVIPAYNESAMIEKAVSKISSVLLQEDILYELIFVNDGSKDDTWKKIKAVSSANPYIIGLSFSRNFGKEAAIYAGLSYASGDVVAVMDCDLQHPTETLVEMYRLWQQGYEVIEGVKTDRGKESFFHRLSAGTFYKIMSSATGIDMANASDFKLMDRKVVDALCAMPERNTFFRALSSWVGFRTVTVYFEVQDRAAGTSKWSTKSLIKYALNNISAFTAAPLQFVTIGGVIMLLFAIILGLQTIIHYMRGTAVEGFTTVILLVLLCSSIMMMSLGIIGYYLSKIYDEIKRRPKYIISEELRREE